MILAYLNGDLIRCSLVKKNPITTIVKDFEGKEYCYRQTDTHRKLFDGDKAVHQAIEWIEKERGITIKV